MRGGRGLIDRDFAVRGEKKSSGEGVETILGRFLDQPMDSSEDQIVP